MIKLKKIGGVLGGLLLAITHANAAGTSAGAPISNQATVSYDAGAGTVTANSGTVTFKVQELVKGTVAKLDAGNISISSPQNDAAMKFKLKNDGNGDEGFKIVVTQDSGDDFDVTLSSFYVDDGDGILDIAVDTLYNNANPPSIAPDGELTIWVTSNIPASLADAALANLNVSAVSSTFANDGQNNPNAGDVVIGGGDSSTDAVNAVAIASVTSTFVVSDIDVAIVKAISATRDLLGGGGSKAVPGAEVDYTLTVTVTGTGAANNIVVSDPLPTQLKLKNGITGTVTVGGVAETASNADADGTSYDANTNTITVDLGNINAGDPAIAIQFTTVIQ
ncbi:isopeptide-forming domain-containing fimbrial protein [Pseudomonas sp. HK3]